MSKCINYPWFHHRLLDSVQIFDETFGVPFLTAYHGEQPQNEKNGGLFWNVSNSSIPYVY